MSNLRLLSFTAFVTFLATGANAAPTITAYLSAPNEQFAPSGFSNLSVETFNALPVGNDDDGFTSPIGTYSGGRIGILADDIYGNGTGNYFAFGNQTGTSAPVVLTFSTPIAYFGIAYQAGDVNNGFTFYDNSNAFLGRFSTETLLNFFTNSGGTVTATNSATYNTSQYFGKPNGLGAGQPNTGQNTGEPYSFLNFFFTGGTVGRIVFDNSGNNSSTSLESDNHTISTTPQNPSGTPLVFVQNVAVVPEAGTLALFAFAGVHAIGAIVARRRK